MRWVPGEPHTFSTGDPRRGGGVMCAPATLEALLELLDYSGQEGARE